MKPLLTEQLTAQLTALAGKDRVFDPKHGVFVAGWLMLPFLAFGLRSRGRMQAAACLLALGLVGGGYWLCTETAVTINTHGVAAAGSFPIIIRGAFLGIIALGAIVCVFSLVAAAWTGLKGRTGHTSAGRSLSARLGASSAWFAAALVASLVGLWAKASVWLGWYTNDTRVNLLEPLSVVAPLVATGLAVMAMLFSAVIWRKRERQLWRPVGFAIGLSSVAAMLAGWLVPDPPRISNFSGRGDYVLTTEGNLIEYGDWEASIRAGHPRFVLTIVKDRGRSDQSPSKMDAKAQEMLEAGKESLEIGNLPLYSFNSGNVYSHLFGKAWLQIPLIIFAITALASAGVISVWILGSMLSACVKATLAGAWVLFGLVAVQWLACGVLAFWLGNTGLQAIRAHAMDLVLMHVRGEVLLDHALEALLVYRADDDEPGYWRLPWNLVPSLYTDFDTEFHLLAGRELYALHQIGTYGGTDNLSFSNDSELETRAKLVGMAVQARGSLFAHCETFPDELQHRLQQEGFPPRLIEAAVTSWKRELMALRPANITRLQRLTDEYNLLYWMARNQKYWTVDRPGSPPTFSDHEYLTEYVGRLSRIVDLKESEIFQMRKLQSRLTWVDPDFPKSVEIALRFIAIQRRFLSYFSDPSRYISSETLQFKDPNLSERYSAVLRELETFGSPVGSEPESPGAALPTSANKSDTRGTQPRPLSDASKDQQYEELKTMVHGQIEQIATLKSLQLATEGVQGYVVGSDLLNLEQRRLVQQENVLRERIFELIGERTGHSREEIAAIFADMAQRSATNGRPAPAD